MGNAEELCIPDSYDTDIYRCLVLWTIILKVAKFQIAKDKTLSKRLFLCLAYIDSYEPTISVTKLIKTFQTSQVQHIKSKIFFKSKRPHDDAN